MKKIIVFGSSSFLASKIIDKFKKKYSILSFSKTKTNYDGAVNIKTNYNLISIKKVLKKNISSKDELIFLFFNSISDNRIFININSNHIKKIIYVNQILPILITNLILKNYLNQKPKFIYISSSRAKKGDFGISLYSSTKNAISSFVKNMAQEYGKFGIIFRVILLGLFKGGMEKKLKKKNIDKILQETYNSKYVDIKSLIKTLNYSISDESGNGSELNCDNGYR